VVELTDNSQLGKSRAASGGRRSHHVGTLGYYAELLKRVTDSAFHEGEHAE
jgi:hypothetical protein